MCVNTPVLLPKLSGSGTPCTRLLSKGLHQRSFGIKGLPALLECIARGTNVFARQLTVHLQHGADTRDKWEMKPHRGATLLCLVPGAWLPRSGTC
jgi:hypothetical protein